MRVPTGRRENFSSADGSWECQPFLKRRAVQSLELLQPRRVNNMILSVRRGSIRINNDILRISQTDYLDTEVEEVAMRLGLWRRRNTCDWRRVTWCSPSVARFQLTTLLRSRLPGFLFGRVDLCNFFRSTAPSTANTTSFSIVLNATVSGEKYSCVAPAHPAGSPRLPNICLLGYQRLA